MRRKEPKYWSIKLVIYIKVHGMMMRLGREGNSSLKWTLLGDNFDQAEEGPSFDSSYAKKEEREHTQ